VNDKRKWESLLARVASALLLMSSAWAGTAPLSLQTVTKAAGLIFKGQVIRVERVPSNFGTDEAMQITFRVTQAMRGTRTSQMLTIREWAGLWRHRGEQYRVGEKVMLFLYRNNHMGLTSPVGGRAGRFEIDEQDNVALRPEQVKMIKDKLARITVVAPMQVRPGSSSINESVRAPLIRSQDLMRLVRQEAMQR